MSPWPPDELLPPPGATNMHEEEWSTAVDNLVGAGENLENACSDYVDAPTQEAFDLVKARRKEKVGAMFVTLRQVYDPSSSMSDSERHEIAGTLLFSEDAKLAGFLNATTGKQKFEPDEPSIEASIETVVAFAGTCETTDELIMDLAKGVYGPSLKATMKGLRKCVPIASEQLPQTATPRVNLGSLALEALKQSPGFAAASWLIKQARSIVAW